MTKFVLNTRSPAWVKQAEAANIDVILLDSDKISRLNREIWQRQLNSKTKLIPLINLSKLPSFNDIDNDQRKDFPIAIAIPPKFNDFDTALIKSLNYFESKFAVVPAAGFIGRDLSPLFEFLERFSFNTVMVELAAADAASCLHSENLEFAARVHWLCVNNDLEFGLLGTFEDPDIPRLVHFHLDYVGLTEIDNKDNNVQRKIGFFERYNKMVERDNNIKIKRTKQESFDKLIVRDFILPAAVGAYEHEHKKSQKICFNVVALVERVARHSQTINDVTSYDIILDAIRRVISAGHHELVETIGESVASLILTNPQIKSVTIRVEKLELGPAGVGIEITRYRDQP